MTWSFFIMAKYILLCLVVLTFFSCVIAEENRPIYVDGVKQPYYIRKSYDDTYYVYRELITENTVVWQSI